MSRAAPASPFRVVAIAALCAAAAACASGSAAKKPAPLPPTQVGRPVLASTQEAMNLQSSVMALADTAMQRIGAGLSLSGEAQSPEVRREQTNTRLLLASALISNATQPDPVDALADIVTNATLTADAQRNAARGKDPGSLEARLLAVLELNEADAWRLAERWINEPTRDALRARIAAWSGPRDSAAAVAFVRLSDIERGGATSIEAGEGMFDSLRAATAQADQVRLLAERSLYLLQRMPFLMRWQAEVYTAGALATQEAQQTQARIEEMTKVTAAMTDVVAGMTGQVSEERRKALEDLFGHVSAERQATLEQVLQIIRQERKATLSEVGAALDQQREAAFRDILKITDAAGRTGSAWIWRTLAVGSALIVLLLVGLLGVLLLYRRLARPSASRA